jgi:alkyldihydroxyacetonephosphate synthase
MTQARLKHFGWGREGESLTPAEEAFVLARIEQLFGPLAEGKVKPPRLEDIKLAPPRLDPPPSLPFCSTALYDRAAHTYGKSFPDYVRGLVGDYSNAPDVVAYPRNEEEVVAVLDWAREAQASATPSAADRASSAGLNHTAMRRGTRGR